MLSKTCLLKTSEAGMSWEARIVREKPNYFICERDWPQFVVHHQLEPSDILIFSLIEKSSFHHAVAHLVQLTIKILSGKKYHQIERTKKLHSGSEEYGLKRNSTRCSLVISNSHDDYYEIVVKKSHTTFMLDFSYKGKKEWEVEIVHTGPRVIIKNGWAEFRTHNKIAS
ncbi:hypothetical protein H5410_006661 [Solanum commersonii]|uniref:TF-B3 domain-containing protein n=1 Tax=Solanum commersonii TaxID=4109 RepID=A0A9J6AAX0_SOLCO|nr:hypothetical protein H5410_006661 [Solanum commersonii]